MSVLVVPTFSDPSWSQATTFEGTKYTMQFDFNQRACCWYLSIADADGVDIYNGVKISCGPLLLRKCKDLRRPPGDLVCVSSTADNSPPTMLDLLAGSGRCTLLYITSDWLAAIETQNAASIDSILTQLSSGGNTASPVSPYGLL